MSLVKVIKRLRLYFHQRIESIITNHPLTSRLLKTSEELEYRANSTDAHLIALCRVLFITPDVLLREVNNHKANARYILELIKARDSISKVDKVDKVDKASNKKE